MSRQVFRLAKRFCSYENIRGTQLDSSVGIATRCASSPKTPKSSLAGLAPGIFPAVTYSIDCDQGARLGLKSERSQADEDGYFYSRWGNPTNQVTAGMIASLEEAKAGTYLTASGMMSISCTLCSLLKSGDHVVFPQALYGGTYELVMEFLKHYGIEYTFADQNNLENVVNAIKPNTKLIYAETPCNPTLRITDLFTLGEICSSRNIPLAVDSTFSSPILMQTLKIPGVTISIHAATKYMNGHSDVLAGTVSSHDQNFMQRFGKALKIFGAPLPATDSYMLQRGIRTLHVRMRQHSENAMAIAEYLSSHPKIKSVFYPGLTSHPEHDLAKQLFNPGAGFGGMMAFEVDGTVEETKQFAEALRIINVAVSLGSVESLLEHPASMTHTMVSKEDRLKGGITDGLIRMSVGIEDVKDLIQDLDQALSKVFKSYNVL